MQTMDLKEKTWVADNKAKNTFTYKGVKTVLEKLYFYRDVHTKISEGVELNNLSSVQAYVTRELQINVDEEDLKAFILDTDEEWSKLLSTESPPGATKTVYMKDIGLRGVSTRGVSATIASAPYAWSNKGSSSSSSSNLDKDEEEEQKLRGRGLVMMVVKTNRTTSEEDDEDVEDPKILLTNDKGKSYVVSTPPPHCPPLAEKQLQRNNASQCSRAPLPYKEGQSLTRETLKSVCGRYREKGRMTLEEVLEIHCSHVKSEALKASIEGSNSCIVTLPKNEVTCSKPYLHKLTSRIKRDEEGFTGMGIMELKPQDEEDEDEVYQRMESLVFCVYW